MKMGNKIKLRKLDKKDNTVTEGWISSEQLREEMKKTAENTISYIEAQKKALSEEDRKTMIEAINDENFRAQLKKAVQEDQDKIDNIYNQRRLSDKMNKSIENFKAKRKEYEKAYKDFEREALKKENEELKAQLRSVKNVDKN